MRIDIHKWNWWPNKNPWRATFLSSRPSLDSQSAFVLLLDFQASRTKKNSVYNLPSLWYFLYLPKQTNAKTGKGKVRGREKKAPQE
jgi:hypothetical protein